jgi:hypothetical protein
MPVNDPTQAAHLARTPLAEALAARVEIAADASMAAYHAAADNRRRIHESEWAQPERDTLWDIEEVADALHGYASWVLGASRHPRVSDVRARLEKLKGDIPELRRKLDEAHAGSKHLADYISRLDELRAALVGYFEEETRASSDRNDSPPVRPPAST